MWPQRNQGDLLNFSQVVKFYMAPFIIQVEIIKRLLWYSCTIRIHLLVMSTKPNHSHRLDTNCLSSIKSSLTQIHTLYNHPQLTQHKSPKYKCIFIMQSMREKTAGCSRALVNTFDEWTGLTTNRHVSARTRVFHRHF